MAAKRQKEVSITLSRKQLRAILKAAPKERAQIPDGPPPPGITITVTHDMGRLVKRAREQYSYHTFWSNLDEYPDA